MHVPPRGDGGTAGAATRDAGSGASLRYEALRFPGCVRISLSRAEFEDFDDRIEYWDARTETAWVVADKYGVHEGTSRRLPHLAERIASVRGTPIVSYGSVTLLVRDAAGEPRRAMEADETLLPPPDPHRSMPESAAFPGWTAGEIHDGMAEPTPSAATYRVLERVGRALGAQEGTGPADDPLSRVLLAEGRTHELTAAAQSLLRVRGLAVSPAFPERAVALCDVPRDTVMAAAYACADEADFWLRLGKART